MKALDLLPFIGQECKYDLGDGFIVRCRIVDAKYAFGKLRFFITPMQGSGNRWVLGESVTLEEYVFPCETDD